MTSMLVPACGVQLMCSFLAGGMDSQRLWTLLFGLRTNVIDRVATDGSAAVVAYEHRKRSHLGTEDLCSQEGFSFIPLVVEAHGGSWGFEARKAFSNIALRATATSGESSAVAVDKLTQRLCCLLQRENARAVLKRLPGWAASQDAAALDAASMLCPG